MENTVRIPQQKRSIEKKNKILEAATQEFNERGYYKTTTVDIAKRAGVSTGILYGYFKDKKDIFLQLIDMCFSEFYAPLQQAFKQMQPPLNIPQFLSMLMSKTIEAHKNSFMSPEEMVAMSHLDEDVHNAFIKAEKNATFLIAGELKKLGFDLPNLIEKVRLAYVILENYSHECSFHHNDYIDYDKMKELAIKTITSIFQKD